MEKPNLFIFISGLKSEFGDARTELKKYFKDRHNINVFIFEDSELPSPKKPIEICEEWGRDCDLFILLLGGFYGYMARDGISYTELEYDAAYESNPNKIYIYLKDLTYREPDQEKFVKKISDNHFYKNFNSDLELIRLVSILVNDKLNEYKQKKLPKPRIAVKGSSDSRGFRLYVKNENTYLIIMLNPIELDGNKHNIWTSQSRIDAGEGKESYRIRTVKNSPGPRLIDDNGIFHKTTVFKFDFIGKDETKYRAICKYEQVGEKSNTVIEELYATDEKL